MPKDVSQEVIVRRVEELEKKTLDMGEEVKRLTDGHIQNKIAITEITAQVNSQVNALRGDIASLKQDVMLTVKDHTDRTWRLIDKTWKVITILIAVIVGIAGLRVGPEVIKTLIGG